MEGTEAQRWKNRGKKNLEGEHGELKAEGKWEADTLRYIPLHPFSFETRTPLWLSYDLISKIQTLVSTENEQPCWSQ